jgi:hypothetical protein
MNPIMLDTTAGQEKSLDFSMLSEFSIGITELTGKAPVSYH